MQLIAFTSYKLKYKILFILIMVMLLKQKLNILAQIFKLDSMFSMIIFVTNNQLNYFQVMILPNTTCFTHTNLQSTAG